MNVWYAIFAPRNTPEPILQKLNQAIKEVSLMPEVKRRLVTEGAEAISSTPQELEALMVSDYKKWGEVVRKSGAQVE